MDPLHDAGSSLTVQQLADHIARGNVYCATGFPIVDEHGLDLSGIITRGAIYYGRWKQPLGNRFLSARPVPQRW